MRWAASNRGKCALALVSLYTHVVPMSCPLPRRVPSVGSWVAGVERAEMELDEHGETEPSRSSHRVTLSQDNDRRTESAYPCLRRCAESGRGRRAGVATRRRGTAAGG